MISQCFEQKPGPDGNGNRFGSRLSVGDRALPASVQKVLTLPPTAISALAAFCFAAVGLLLLQPGTAYGDEPRVLPDERVIEMVSPVDKGGSYAQQEAIADDGSKILITTAAPSGDIPSGPVQSSWVAERDPMRGWLTTTMNPPQGFSQVALIDFPDLLPDWSAGVFAATRPDDEALGRWQLHFVHRSGQARPASPLVTPLTVVANASPASYLGGSVDLEHRVFVSPQGLMPDTLALAANNFNLYEVAPAEGGGEVRLVNRETGLAGAPIGGGCGAYLGDSSLQGARKYAVSADGGVIAFSSKVNRTTGVYAPAGSCSSSTFKVRLWARVDGQVTIPLSDTSCDRTPTATVPACGTTLGGTVIDGNNDDRYEGASRDGRRIFISSQRQLTNSDVDATRDLYMIELTADRQHVARTVQVSSRADHPADFQGTVAISDDGSRTYFVSRGVLDAQPNAEGNIAIDGSPNLYVYRDDRSGDEAASIRFVASLDTGDATALFSAGGSRRAMAVPRYRSGSNDPADTLGGNGRYLVFQSRAAVTSDVAPGGGTNVYRYDSAGGELLLLSRGGAPSCDSTLSQTAAKSSLGSSALAGRSVTEDASLVVFTSSCPLVDEDVNNAADAYRWKLGDGPALITDGVFAVGSSGDPWVTPDGSDIVFTTRDRMVDADRDGTGDVYTARVHGTEFDSEDDSANVCIGDECQVTAGPAPSLPLVGSVSFVGDGNVGSVPGSVKASVRVSKLRSVSGSAARLRVRVPGAGRILVAGSRIRRSGRSVSKAGTYPVKITMGSKARKLLRKKQTLRAKARVVYRARGGQSASKVVVVTFKQPKVKRTNARKGGR